MSFFFYILFFIFGLCVGSFLNVLIYRLPKCEKVTGRSYCPSCKKKLRWNDLIPFFSFIFLRGRCRYCGKPISWQYPLVELSTAFLFVLTISNWQLLTNNWQPMIGGWSFFIRFLIVFCSLFIFCCLLVIFVTDLKYMIVPDEIIYPAIGAAFLYQVITNLQLTTYNLQLLISNIYPSVLSGIGAAGFFLFFVLISSGKWMGMGDVKIAGFMGLFLSWPNVLVALLLSFIFGSIIGTGLVFAKIKTFKSEIPFGCFLAPATYVAMFWGSKIIEWYWGII